MLTISYCLANVDDETREALWHWGHEVIEDVCLQRCGHCFEGPFLVIDERLVTGPSHHGILEALQEDELQSC